MKKIKISAVVAVCLILSLLSGCTIVNNTTVATVNGEKITLSEYAIYFTQIQYSMLDEAGILYGEDADKFWSTTEIEGKKALDVAKERALEEAVEVAVKQLKASELNVALSAGEDTALEEQIGSAITSMGGKSEFEKELKKMGTTLSAYKKWVKKGQLGYKVENTLAGFDENRATAEEAEESIKSTYIKAKHILISTIDQETQMPLNPDEVAAKKATAEDILNRIKNGESFDALMKEYSEDPGLETNPDGYEFGKGQMVAEFESAAYALEVGQVSDLVETSYGYHIIKREQLNLTEEKIKEYIPTEQNILIAAKINAVIDKWISETEIEVNEKVLEKLQPLKES